MHLNNTSTILDLGDMKKTQMEDTELHNLRSSPFSLVLKDILLSLSGPMIVCDTSTGLPRPIVPLEFHRVVFHYHILEFKPHNDWLLHDTSGPV